MSIFHTLAYTSLLLIARYAADKPSRTLLQSSSAAAAAAAAAASVSTRLALSLTLEDCLHSELAHLAALELCSSLPLTQVQGSPSPSPPPPKRSPPPPSPSPPPPKSPSPPLPAPKSPPAQPSSASATATGPALPDCHAPVSCSGYMSSCFPGSVHRHRTCSTLGDQLCCQPLISQFLLLAWQRIDFIPCTCRLPLYGLADVLRLTLCCAATATATALSDGDSSAAATAIASAGTTTNAGSSNAAAAASAYSNGDAKSMPQAARETCSVAVQLPSMPGSYYDPQ